MYLESASQRIETCRAHFRKWNAHRCEHFIFQNAIYRFFLVIPTRHHGKTQDSHFLGSWCQQNTICTCACHTSDLLRKLAMVRYAMMMTMTIRVEIISPQCCWCSGCKNNYTHEKKTQIDEHQDSWIPSWIDQSTWLCIMGISTQVRYEIEKLLTFWSLRTQTGTEERKSNLKFHVIAKQHLYCTQIHLHFVLSGWENILALPATSTGKKGS